MLCTGRFERTSEAPLASLTDIVSEVVSVRRWFYVSYNSLIPSSR